MATDTITATQPASATDRGAVWIVTAVGDTGQVYCSFAIAADYPALVAVTARARARHYRIPDRVRLSVAQNYPGAPAFSV